jgi:hypothetical protein
MPSPFPGMDPYLEHPARWPEVHLYLILAIQDELLPQLGPRYYVAVEQRLRSIDPTDPTELALIGIADEAVVAYTAADRPGDGAPGVNGAAVDHHARAPGAQRASPRVVTVSLPRPVEVRERYLEVREAASNEVVTVIEVLSPTNKRGRGRREYEEKRLAIAGSLTNLVEIDLLRAGDPLPVHRQEDPAARGERLAQGDYRVLVSRGFRGHQADLYPIDVREPLPCVSVPLAREDAEPALDLQKVLRSVYERGRFESRIEYREDPVPPLPEAHVEWAHAMLTRAGVRP